MELIRLEKVTFAYPSRQPVLDGLDFQLSRGDRLGVVGPIGAGKSTMFRIAMGLLAPQAGRVLGLGQPCRHEKDFRPLREKVGFLFQDPDDQLFCPTVAEDIAFGPLNLGWGREKALAAVSEVLAQLGMEGFEKRLTHQLSGGEKRLISLAAVLAMGPEALLLDEPSTGLDPEHTAKLEEALLSSDLAWAMVSHDREFLRRTCATVLELKDGHLTTPAAAALPPLA
ncbi:MAG: energy-coupling factor ABC transporter ATP-binding protein [Deltaproteobacteria bacterium]|nr:energy-coupling factor ABC transporter ATP-binding protein [Deltaproteobacteria bacterium]